MANARLNLKTAAIVGNAIRFYLGWHSGVGGLRMRKRNLTPAWPAVRQTFFEHEVETFRRDGAVKGWQKWKDVVGRYADWKRKHFPGKATLRLSGKLMEQMTGASGDHFEKRAPRKFIIGSNYPVAGSAGQKSSWATTGITGGVLPRGFRWSLDDDDEDIGGLHQAGGFSRLDGPGRQIDDIPAREPIRLTDQFVYDVVDDILDHVTQATITKTKREGLRIFRGRR